MIASTRAPEWSRTAIARLEDTAFCPRCQARLTGQLCARCGADYRTIGAELWDASQAAVFALKARQEVLDRVAPVWSDTAANTAAVTASSAPVSAAAPPPVVTRTGPDAPARPARSSATVQSVLAVAGAGLLAIAAIVFTYFNPDLTDGFVRSAVVAVVTAVFLAGASVLARRGLQFSAEVVGALGLVFVGLDIHALTALAPDDPWAVAAVATLIGAVALVAWATVVRVRVWLSTALAALALVPAMIGCAAGAPVLGHLGAALAAFGVLAATPLVGGWWKRPLTGERLALTVIELVAVAAALVQGWLFGGFPIGDEWLALCVTLAAAAALALVSTRHPARGAWSFLSGAFGVGAAAVLPWAVADDLGAWAIALVPAAAVAGAIVWTVLMPTPGTVASGLMRSGGLSVVAVTAIVPAGNAVVQGLTTLVIGGGFLDTAAALATTAGLAAIGAGLAVFAVLSATRGPAPAEGAMPWRWTGLVGLWSGLLSALTLVCVAGIADGVRVALGLALGAALALGLARVPVMRDATPGVRVPISLGAHLLVALSIAVSWNVGASAAAVAGPIVIAAIAALAGAVPAGARFVHVGVGYAYALVVLATALSLAGVEAAALVCLTTSAGALVAIVATFMSRVGARSWYAILAVTAAPFAVGVAQVIFERSGWTALSTALMFGLALTLVVTKRAGLSAPLRIGAGALLVPSLAVVAVCLGAELLVGSGSPVVLPIIAALVALVLPAGPLIRAALAPRIGRKDASLVGVAIEASTLLTAAIAVGLALFRDAAGLSTTLLVLIILCVGGLATALRGGRVYGWWLAAAAFTGALWCAWAMAGVTMLEPYLLPPALGAAVVGAVLTVRGLPALRLYGAGLLTAVGPLLVVLAVEGPWVRAAGLLVAAWALLVLGALLGRGTGRGATRRRPLARTTLVVAVLAGGAGVIEAVRLGTGRDASPLELSLVFTCLVFGLAGALPAALAARTIRSQSEGVERLATTRWLFAPAFLYVAVSGWPSVARDWTTIWTLWTLMLLLLVAVVVIAARGLRARTSLPPVWFVFALAFVTAVVAWSPRDLRVEWFSLPLGAALLVAGGLAMRAWGVGAVPRRGTITDWPAGWAGSWALLGPGIVVTMSASVAATFTDPLTWRAILVIVLALVAILVGASRRLAAPFVIGIVVLPVENAIAFAVQIGRGIQSMPWWITLAVVGAVLLIIAVTYERRAGEEAGIAARLRDLA